MARWKGRSLGFLLIPRWLWSCDVSETSDQELEPWDLPVADIGLLSNNIQVMYLEPGGGALGATGASEMLGSRLRIRVGARQYQ